MTLRGRGSSHVTFRHSHMTLSGWGTIALLRTNLLAVLLLMSMVVLIGATSSRLRGGWLLGLLHSIATGHVTIPTALRDGWLAKRGGALRKGLRCSS